jgi:hypothetical protein
VVISGGQGAATDPPFRSTVSELVTALRGSAVVVDGESTTTFEQLVDPYEAPPQAGFISPDETTVRIEGRVPGERERVRDLLEPVLPIVDATRAAHPELAIHIIGNTFINDDINELISKGLDESLRLTIPLTFLILLFAFGAIVASVIPLVLAITSLVAAFGILGIYSQIVGPVSPNATQLVVLIGLAVAIDYSLFMITRFRVERRVGRDRAKAIEVSSSTAGRAVFFSGMAVMISLASLITLGVAFFTSMAVATVSVVLISVVGSLTFLPATLAILGDRVDLGRPATWLPHLAVFVPLGPVSRWGRSALAWLDRRAARQEGSGFWGGLVTWVMARPIPMTILSAAFLLVLAAPVLQLRTGVTDITGFPDSIDGVAGVKLLTEKWPTGTQLQLGIVVTKADEPDTQAAIERLKVEGLKLDGLNGPVDVTASRDGKAALVSFTMAGGQNDEANRDLVRSVRADLNPSVFGSLPEVRQYVTGGAAYTVPDLRGRNSKDLSIRARTVLPSDARRLPLDRHPDQGDPLEPALHSGRLRRPGPRLPGRLAGRAPWDRPRQCHRKLGPALHLHDPVRAVDGLPLVHPDPDQGGPGSWAGIAGLGRNRDLHDLGHDH